MKTSEFQSFLERSSRYIERALNQEFDLHGNFFEEFQENEGTESAVSLIEGEFAPNKLRKIHTFQETTIMNRSVTSIDWSP